MHHPTFATPDLTTFCRLDELGLETVGQLLEPDRAVIECRVSHMTVSRYLNGAGKVNEASQRRIDAAIAELDYRPNLVARSMRKRRKGLLAVLIPATDNPYNPTSVLASASVEAHRLGYQIEVVMVSGGVKERTARALELSASGLVEGIVSLARLAPGTTDRVHNGDAPIETFEIYDDLLRGAGIMLDATPIALITEELFRLGHRRFAYVTGPPDYPAAQAREAAYRSTAERLGVDTYGIIGASWSPRVAAQAVADLPDGTGITAMVCANDELAAGAIHSALSRGWSVPETISVTGWDNFTLGEFLPPGLTTVNVEHRLLSEYAINLVVARLRGTPPPPPFEASGLNTLIWRGSVAPPGEGA